MPKYVKLIILDNENRVLSHNHSGDIDVPTARVRVNNPMSVAEKYARKFMRHPHTRIIGTPPDVWYFAVDDGPLNLPHGYSWREQSDFTDPEIRERIKTAVKKKEKD